MHVSQHYLSVERVFVHSVTYVSDGTVVATWHIANNVKFVCNIVVSILPQLPAPGDCAMNTGCLICRIVRCTVRHEQSAAIGGGVSDRWYNDAVATPCRTTGTRCLRGQCDLSQIALTDGKQNSSRR